MRKAQRAAEEGGRPHDQRARACLEDAALALELGLSVYRKRRRLVRLDVWLVVSPVEDEVGREMDQGRALAPASDGDEKRTLRVDRERLVGLRLGTVDGVVGSAVEDDLRLAGRDQGVDRLRVRDRNLLVRHSTGGTQQADELRSELALRPQHKSVQPDSVSLSLVSPACCISSAVISVASAGRPTRKP